MRKKLIQGLQEQHNDFNVNDDDNQRAIFNKKADNQYYNDWSLLHQKQSTSEGSNTNTTTYNSSSLHCHDIQQVSQVTPPRRIIAEDMQTDNLTDDDNTNNPQDRAQKPLPGDWNYKSDDEVSIDVTDLTQPRPHHDRSAPMLIHKLLHLIYTNNIEDLYHDELACYTQFLENAVAMVVGQKNWKKNVCEKKYYEFVTVSDEAFALLVLDNNCLRYFDMLHNDPIDAEDKRKMTMKEVKKKWIRPRYTIMSGSNNGGSKGWTMEGKKKYQYYYHFVSTFRKDYEYKMMDVAVDLQRSNSYLAKRTHSLFNDTAGRGTTKEQDDWEAFLGEIDGGQRCNYNNTEIEPVVDCDDYNNQTEDSSDDEMNNNEQEQNICNSDRRYRQKERSSRRIEHDEKMNGNKISSTQYDNDDERSQFSHHHHFTVDNRSSPLSNKSQILPPSKQYKKQEEEEEEQQSSSQHRAEPLYKSRDIITPSNKSSTTIDSTKTCSSASAAPTSKKRKQRQRLQKDQATTDNDNNQLSIEGSKRHHYNTRHKGKKPKRSIIFGVSV